MSDETEKRLTLRLPVSLVQVLEKGWTDTIKAATAQGFPRPSFSAHVRLVLDVGSKALAAQRAEKSAD